MKRILISLAAFSISMSVAAQQTIGAAESIEQLKSQYQGLKQPNFNKHTMFPSDIYPVIDELKTSASYKVVEAGQSYLGKPIYHIQFGQGKRHIFMWTQMHGDEPTATASVFDLINYINATENQQWVQSWYNELTLHIMPMVNPDGAELEQRFNAQGIDINRDAKRLQTPEGRTLLKMADSIKPEFGFNLHDQNRFYTAGDSANPTTISLLAPAFNDAKDISVSRRHAMQLIGILNDSIQYQYPGHVGRYDDTYSYRSFGDLFSGKNIATTLIEAGGHHNDPNRQVARWLTFMMLVQAIDVINNKSYLGGSLAKHDAIPMNKSRGLVDVLLKNVSVAGDYHVDISVNLGRDFSFARISEVGDISHGNAFETHDMSGYELIPARAFNVTKALILSDKNYQQLLLKGISYFIDPNNLLQIETQLPVIRTKSELPAIPQRNKRASFIFTKQDKVKVAIINGQRINL